jgi:long-chain acyl-CoA synthetase
MVRSVVEALRPRLVIAAEPGFGDWPQALVNPSAGFEPAAAALGAEVSATAGLAEPPDTALLFTGFTSGSTGLPKGYRRSHGSWVASFEAEAAEFGLGADDVVLAPGTLTHSLFLYALASGLHAGARVVLCRSFRPDTALRLVSEHGVTVLYGVPTQIAAILHAAAERDERPESLRLILSSGAKWTGPTGPQIRTVFPNARFAEFFGASETSFIAVAKEDEPVPEGSVGRAFRGVSLSVRDRSGRRLPLGRIGRVFAQSPFLFSGYAFGNEDGLSRCGTALSVGDLGYLDPSGFLHLVGREARKIVTSGQNVFPEEIERLLARHPAVTDAAVLGVADAKRGERLLGIVRTQGGESVNRASLVSHLRPLLPLARIPRRYVTVADWPLTRSGKTDFSTLMSRWRAGELAELP